MHSDGATFQMNSEITSLGEITFGWQTARLLRFENEAFSVTWAKG